MVTKILPPSQENIALLAQAILHDELVAFPTETVYGLGANAYHGDAVKKIFAAKGRPSDNPLIVHFGKTDDICKATKTITPVAEKLIAAFMPGPITLVLPKRAEISPVVCAGLDTVGVRIPLHPVAKDFLSACGVPVAAPSANTSSRPSPTSSRHVFEDMKGKIGYILEGGNAQVGIESTVILATERLPVILRPGRVTGEDVARVCGDVRFSAGVSDVARAPGMKYKHYAPNVPVTLFGRDKLNELRAYVALSKGNIKILCLASTAKELEGLPVTILGDTPDRLAQNLFAALRDEEKHCDEILLEAPDAVGFGISLLDRMNKAAGGRIL